MLQVIRFIVYYFILPAIYLLILLFDFNLVRRGQSQTERIQMLLGVVAGILTSVVVIMLDLETDLFSVLIDLPDPTSIAAIWPYVVIAFLLGVFLMLIIHLLLRVQKILSFVVMFNILGIIASGYFLVSLSNIRTIFAVSSLGFLVGIVIYFMLAPGVLPLLIRGIPARREKSEQGADWS
jgi:hypothetical protein